MNQIKNYFNTYPFSKVVFVLTFLMLISIVLMNIFFPDIQVNGFSDFIIAFEFARSPHEIHSLLDGLGTSGIIKVDIGNYIDFGFMLSYTSLIGYLYFGLSKAFDRKAIKVGIFLAIIVLLGDLMENVMLLKITKHILTESDDAGLIPLLTNLHIFTWIKWAGLAVAFLGLAPVFVTQKWYHLVLGLFCAVPIIYLAIIAGNLSPYLTENYIVTIYLAFFSAIVFGLTFKRNVLDD